MWLQLCLWVGVAASLPSFDPTVTKPSLAKADKKPRGRSSREVRPSQEGLRYPGDSPRSSREARPREEGSRYPGGSTVPTVRHCSSPSGSVDGRILVEEVGYRDICI